MRRIRPAAAFPAEGSALARPTGNTSSGPEESGRLADLWRPDGLGICILKLLADSGKCCMFAMEINTFSERLAPRIRLNLNSAFIYFSNRCTVFLFPLSDGCTSL